MRSKKAQVTIFIIAGIIILFATFFFLFIRTQILKQPVELAIIKGPLEAQPVKTFVDACVKDSLVKGSYLVASHGGYAIPAAKSLFTENNFITYSFDDGLAKVPSASDVGKQLAEYIKSTLPVCTAGFESFKKQGYFIVEESPIASVSVGTNSVTASVTYPLTITFANKTSKLSGFQADVPIRMGQMLGVVSGIAKNENIDDIDLNYLGTIGYNITITPYDSETVIYTIYDPRSNFENAPFMFNFASRSPDSNSAPELEFIPDFVLGVNESFIYDVLASDPDEDELTFTDNSNLFDIDPSTGEIAFTPNAKGEAEVLITVIDSKANSHSQFVRFTVR